MRIVFRHSWRVALRTALCLCLAAALAAAGANLLVCLSTRPDIHTIATAEGLSGDCILVLGCGLTEDGTPGQMLRDRLDTAIAAYQMGVANRLLMSGDHGRDDYDEVSAMKRYAIEKGVPSEDIFVDHAGFSTYESMVRAKEIFQCGSVVVVTQTYHLYRALYNARAMGMEAVGIASQEHAYTRQWYFNLREAAARLKDVVYCAARPEPTYWGQAVSIFSADGNMTNERW